MDNTFIRSLKAVGLAILTAATGVSDATAALNLPIKTVNGRRYYYHVVQSKETIYSLSRQLGVERAEIARYNPSIIDGLRANETLYFPVDVFGEPDAKPVQPSAQPTSTKTVTSHLVQKGETAYGIAHRYGCTVDELVAANPDIRDGVKSGEIITIPATCDIAQTQIEETYPEERVTPLTDTDTALQESGQQQLTETPQAVPDSAYSDSAEDDAMVNIAVMLPFQLDRERPSKQALHYTDFFRGLLMAVDTMRTCGTPIHVYAYDTCDNADTIASILANRPEMAEMDMIIAPDDTAHIEMIAQHADTVAATVINMFAVRDNSHLRHCSVLQGNIPHEMMYTKAIDSFIKMFDGYTPVILNQSDDANNCDKAQFVNALTSRLDNDGIPYRTIEYTGNLSDADIAWMTPGERYIAIPTSSSRATLNAILPALSEKRTRIDAPEELRLFGFPEWIILRGDLQKKLYEMNTTIYSRFVMDTDNYRTRNLANRFQQWYGTAMIPTAPMQGTLGYDTGMWAILTSLGNESDYKGLQTGFSPVPVGDGEQGWINNSLYFIHFLPSGTIERTSL